MKIQRLQITNIASIESALIDFDRPPLSTTDVFLISGNVGAGKSTILDCICLALYGGTPRLNPASRSEDADTGRIMREGTGFSSVCLDFIANDGTQCCAVWSRQRARKKPAGKLQKAVRSLTLGPGTESEMTFTRNIEIGKEIRRTVGLDYQDFCRTTLLAQGQFASFLKGSDDDKAGILEKLTGTQKYTRIGKRIYQACQDAEDACRDEQARLDAIVCLTAEQREALEKNLKAEAVKAADARRRLDEARGRHGWLVNSQRLRVALAAARAGLDKARADYAAGSAAGRRRFIADWEAAEQARSAEAQARLRERECKAAENDIAKLEMEVMELREAYAFLCRPDILDGLVRTKDETDRCLAEVAETVVIAEASLKNAEFELFRCRAFHIRMLERELVDEERSVNEKISRRDALALELDRLEAVAGEAATAYANVSAGLDATVMKIRAALGPGDVCPVCLRKLNSVIPFDRVEFEAVLLPLKQRCDSTRKAVDDAGKAMSALNAEIKIGKEHYLADRAALEAEKTQFGREQAVSGVDIGAADFPEPCPAVEAKAMVARASAACDKARSVCLKTARTLSDAKEKASSAAARLDAAVVTLDRHRMALKPLLESLREARPEWFRQGVKEAKAFNDALLMSAPQFLARFSGLESRRSAAKAAAESFRKQVRDFIASKNIDMEYFVGLCAVGPEEIGRLRAAEKALADAVTAAAAAVAGIEKDIENSDAGRPAGLPADATPDSLDAEVQASAAEQEEAQTAVGRIQAAIDDDCSKAKRRDEILSGMKDLLEARDLYRSLSELFGSSDGKKFRTIAQSYVLANLIYSANHYMRTLMPRYRLVGTPNTYSIDVEDSYDGYARRSAKHISGGETFIVSLALALALADIGTSLAVDTLFIDEGFGNLSGKPLEDAVETLRTLRRKGGRRVGIISHIESLRERIPVQICVEQAPGRNSSRIRIADASGAAASGYDAVSPPSMG